MAVNMIRHNILENSMAASAFDALCVDAPEQAIPGTMMVRLVSSPKECENRPLR